jgi:FkbM family methyltransferase
MPVNDADLNCQPEAAAADLMLQGRFAEASRLLSEALAQCETADRWNHWSVAELMLAQHGLRRALEIDPAHAKAAMNLGALLFALGRRDEAASFLERAVPSLTGESQEVTLTLLALCRPRVNPARRAEEREALQRQARLILDEYFEKGNRSSGVAAPEGFVPKVDSQPLWLEIFLKRGYIHDEDYVVFGAFRDPESTILDVGAHSGYSVTSIWSSGAASSVISFEPNKQIENCLRRLTELRPGRYDYRLVALANTEGALSFAVPCVNGHAMAALTTACPSPDTAWLARNVADAFESSFLDQTITSFLVYSFEAPAARLDDLLAAGGFSIPTHKIVAIKVDAEGYEAEALAGCPELLAKQKPLILAESGHTNPAVFRQVAPLGYVYACRTGKQLEIVAEPKCTMNGFLLHPDHADEYRSIGLLRA